MKDDDILFQIESAIQQTFLLREKTTGSDIMKNRLYEHITFLIKMREIILDRCVNERK